MSDKKIRILNFDDSIIKQKKLLSQYENEVIELKDLGPLVRNWIDLKYRVHIQKLLGAISKNSITFLGSGDFHHISEMLISQFDEPMSVIIFDFHPDWTILPPRFGCGSWVNEVLKKKNILKLVLVGVSSSDISTFDIQSANLDSLKDGRVEIYPYAHKPTAVFFKKIPKNISIEVKKGLFFNKIYWQELKNKDLAKFFQKLLERIPSKKVYVSIDKDCLKNDYALTNWEEGKFSLEELLLMLKLIKENLDILGLDITGDYSDVLIKSVFKRVASSIDHPKKIKARRLTQSLITTVNEDTNLKILKTLLQ